MKAPSDAERQVLADELVEQGDPRGELIHLQLRLALPGAETPALRARERELLERHAPDWVAPLREVISRTGGQAQFGFRGGFIEDVAIEASIAPAVLPALCALAPIRRLALRGATREVAAALGAVPEIADLVALDFGSTFLDARALSLFLDSAGAKLARLEGLLLARNLLGPPAAAALAASRHLGSLRDLDLRHNSLGLQGVLALTRDGALPSLRRIGLSHNRVFPRAPQVQYDWSGSVVGEVRAEEEGPKELAARFEGRGLQVF